MTIWFTSDLHLGHEKALQYMPDTRFFESVGHMLDVYTCVWNGLVDDKDEVYILGDLYWGKENAKHYLNLKGRLHVILGNHDDRAVLEKLGCFESIRDYAEIKVDGRKVVLSHYPFEEWNGKRHGSLHFHGHCHGNSSHQIGRMKNRIDVGPDNWGGMLLKTYEDVVRVLELKEGY